MINEDTIRQIARQTPPNSSFNIMFAEIDRLRAIVGCDDKCETCAGECELTASDAADEQITAPGTSL